MNANSNGAPFSGRNLPDDLFRKCLFYLFLLGLIIRAGYMVEHARLPSFGVLTLDQKYYDAAARMILNGEDLRQLHGLRPLLYPMFLATVYKTGGPHGIDLAIALQHLFGVLTVVLVALVGGQVFRNRLAGLIGGLFYALAPVPLYFEGELLIESSYAFLICLGLLFVFRAMESSGSRAAIFWTLSGALTVLTAQARANILVFMAVYPLLALWRLWRVRKTAALVPLCALAGALAMAVPWGFVNKMQAGQFHVIPTAGGVNLYLGNRRGADGMEPEQGRRVNYGERYEDSVEVWAREEYESAMKKSGRQPSTDPMAVSKYWTGRAVEEIRADPGAWLKLMARKCWLLLWNEEVPNNKAFAFEQTESTWLRMLPVRWVVLLVLLPAGIWAAIRWGAREKLAVLVAYALLYSVGNTAFFICDRYRYPVWPAMAAMAGGGLLFVIDAVQARQWRTTGILLGSILLMGAVSLPDWFGARLPDFARDYMFRSIAWYEKGRFPEALADADKSLQLDPDEVTALHHRGNVLLAMGRFGDARADFERTLRLDAEDGGIWNNYAMALDGLGRTNEALQAFRRATDCKPPSKSAFIAIAFEEIRAGHLDEAAAALDQLDSFNKQPGAISLATRSVIARKKGDTARATALEEEARHMDAQAAAWAIDRANSTGPLHP